LRAEITLNGFQLSALDSEILDIPKRFAVLGVAKILHKSIVPACSDLFQVNMTNEGNLCVPALRFESALADVVVASRACKGEVVGEHGIKCAKVLFLPSRVPAPTSAQAPVASRFLRDTATLVITDSPFRLGFSTLRVCAKRS
jgi:hypothetical protein